MDINPSNSSHIARRETSQRVIVLRAMSLLELVAVTSIIGLVSLTAITRFGHSTIDNTSAEGFTRKLSLDLLQARRRTIATGDNHYLQLTISGSNVTSYVLMRRASGGDTAIDEVKTVPGGVAVTTSHTTLEFDFEGAALAGYSISISGPNRSWSLSVITVTGMVEVLETT